MSGLLSIWHNLGGWHQASLIMSTIAFLFDYILKCTFLKKPAS